MSEQPFRRRPTALSPTSEHNKTANNASVSRNAVKRDGVQAPLQRKWHASREKNGEYVNSEHAHSEPELRVRPARCSRRNPITSIGARQLALPSFKRHEKEKKKEKGARQWNRKKERKKERTV